LGSKIAHGPGPGECNHVLRGALYHLLSNRTYLGLADDELKVMPITQHRHLERTARLAYPAPDIVRAIVDGRHPKSLTARDLARLGSLPLSWSEQRTMLGFTPAWSPNDF
jgi:hypothetical protein